MHQCVYDGVVPSFSSAADRVAQTVGDAIITGEFAPGSFLTEGEIGERLAVSRTPVREAFLLLEARRLLRLFPKKGAVVTSPTDRETTELLQVRLMLEPTAVRARAARAEAADELEADLSALLSEQAAAVGAGDALAFARTDHAFHSRIVAESRNRVIDEFHQQLGPRLERLIHQAGARNVDAFRRQLDEHRELASAAVEGRAEAFEASLHEHLRLGYGAVLS